MLRPKSLAGRIMIIVVVCVLMLLIGIGTALQYLMPRYAGSVYDQAEVALNGIAAQVQNAFSSISLDIRELCVDERLQESIRHWQTQDSPAEKMTAEHRIVSMLYNGVGQNVGGVHFCMEDGQRVNAGRIRMSGRQLSEALQYSESREEELWMSVTDNPGLVCMIVPVHSVKPTDYYVPLGYMIAEVNVYRMLRGLLGLNWENSDAYRLSVRCEDQIIFQDREGSIPDAVWKGSGNSEIGVKTINEELRYQLADSFLINKQKWIVCVDMPLERLSGLVRRTYEALALIALIVVAVTALIVWRLAHSISMQFNSLVSKMELFEQGQYQPPKMLPPHSRDELAELNRCFDDMAVRYERLVKENYVKQLLLTETKLRALEHQINPHFIFNTLEIINHYAKQGEVDNIDTVVHALADLLRASIDQRENTVSMAREISFADSFLQIQSRRFAEMLSCQMDIDPEVMSARIPKLTIMPLIDNAIRYTLEEEEQCMLRVVACRKNEYLYVGVTDNGPPLDEKIVERLRSGEVLSKGNGIGILNIDDRIKLIYGEEYGLKVENKTDEKTISFLIPFETEESEQKEVPDEVQAADR